MKFKVLLVEDDCTDRCHFERLLSSQGHQVQSATSVEDALSKFRDGKFDCLLIDYCLGGQTGIQLAEKIRDIDAKVGIVIVTAKDHSRVEAECEGLLIWSVLQKPIPVKRLIQSVEDAGGLANMDPETESRFIQAFSLETDNTKKLKTDLMNETGQYPTAL